MAPQEFLVVRDSFKMLRVEADLIGWQKYNRILQIVLQN